MKNLILILCSCAVLTNCKDEDYSPVENPTNDSLNAVVQAEFGSNIDFDNLLNYENQAIPNYITKDNTNGNTITDEKATLGRILFYDKNLSTDNTIACASCHQQGFAFSDSADVSTGVNGATGRHSMRLVNARFADEVRFFWDERAVSLEVQTTQPIQDHAEMGFSGQNGAPELQDLMNKLADTDYYPLIFEHIYGDRNITEARLQEALAQFVRSIQSFDSKFDSGLAQTGNLNQDFPNFTAQENQGKSLFIAPPSQGGAGCIGCHRGPEFDVDPNSLNNGVTTVFGSTTEIDEDVTRSPSLRDLFNPQGDLNGNLMHDASFTSVEDVIMHYNAITPGNNQNLDPRLQGGPGQNGQQLNLTTDEVEALASFLRTLTGSDIYTNEKWSDPFNN